MNRTTPSPVCPTFLICREIREDRETGVSLVGLVVAFEKHLFPAARSLGFFARVTSAHGDYQIEIQLQNSHGDVVWRDAPPARWSLSDPLKMYDLKLNVCPVFPEPGRYEFVLLANDEEIARHRFNVVLAKQPAPK